MSQRQAAIRPDP